MLGLHTLTPTNTINHHSHIVQINTYFSIYPSIKCCYMYAASPLAALRTPDLTNVAIHVHPIRTPSLNLTPMLYPHPETYVHASLVHRATYYYYCYSMQIIYTYTCRPEILLILHPMLGSSLPLLGNSYRLRCPIGPHSKQGPITLSCAGSAWYTQKSYGADASDVRFPRLRIVSSGSLSSVTYVQQQCTLVQTPRLTQTATTRHYIPNYTWPTMRTHL